MGANFHAPWIDRPNPGYTTFSADSMNPALASLDKAITYLKNVIIHCDGAISYNPATGALSWDGPIRIIFNSEDGKALENVVLAGSINLADNQFAFADLEETNGKNIELSAATVTTGSASNFLAENRILLACRNAASDRLYPVALRQPILTVADIKLIPEYPGAVLTCSGSNNDPGTKGMTSDLWNSGNNFKNYYEWLSDVTADLQSYDVFVQLPVPHNFAGFQSGTNEALTIEICTKEAGTDNNKIDVTIQRNGFAGTSSLLDQKSSAAETWTTIGFDESNSVLSNVVAGNVLNVRIRLYSRNNCYARLGTITLKANLN